MHQQRSPLFITFAVILIGPLLAYILSKSWHNGMIATQCSPDATVAAYDPESFTGVRLSSSLQTEMQQLASLKQQLEQQITLDVAKQQLQGAKLPPKVSHEAARHLLIHKQLLQHSLQHGHAAARERAIKQHHQASSTATADKSSNNSSSRGILIVGGSRSHLGNAYILLRTLREQLNCTLPIEIVYYGAQELDPTAAALVSSFITAQAAAGQPPITLIDGLAVHKQHIRTLHPHPEVQLRSWVAKIHALCWVTSYQQALYLDSDTLPTQDPSILFLTPQFKSRGFLIWPDFWRDLWMWPAVYKLLGLAVPWEEAADSLSAESGQVVIDRVKHWDVLEWLWMLNAHSELVYECVVGDKDTFKMAFELAGKADRYYQVSHPPMELLGDAGGHKNRFFHLGMGQLSPDGSSLLFLHRTARGKFFPWCAAKRQFNKRCQPAVITLPVVQEQLLASVRDAGSMSFDAHKIDMQWWPQHCCNNCSNSSSKSSGGRSMAVQHAGTEQQVSDQQQQQGNEGSLVSDGATLQWVMSLPVCNYTVGQLPIPAIPTIAISGLPEYLQQLDKLFMQVHALLPVQFLDRVKVFFGKL